MAPRFASSWLPMLLCATCSCTALQPQDRGEWFEVCGAVFEPDANSGGVQDALGAGLGGGIDLNADAVRLSIELFLAWSRHDTDVLDSSGLDEVQLDALRVGAGLRASWRAEQWPVGAYVRGGAAWRGEDTGDVNLPARDEWGSYVGAGLEWWYTPHAALGPCVGQWVGEDTERTETWFALAVRFH